MRDVEPDEVHQPERPEAEAGGVDQDAVDGGEVGDALGQHAQRFGDEGAPGMVDDEAGRVFAAHRRVAEAPGERGQRVARPRLGEDAVHHLDHLHDRHGVEEVIAGDAAGTLARRRHRGHRQRGRVRCEDAVTLDGLLEGREELLLCAQVLDDGFDDDVAGGKAFHRIDDLDSADARIRRGGTEPALFHQLGQRLRYRVLRLARGARLSVEQQGARAALRQDLRDAPAHGAGAGDAGHEIAAVGI